MKSTIRVEIEFSKLSEGREFFYTDVRELICKKIPIIELDGFKYNTIMTDGTAVGMEDDDVVEVERTLKEDCFEDTL